MTMLPPIERDLVVAAGAERAFAAWTDDLASWWPFETHSVYGPGSTAAFRDGVLLETGPDGSTCSWGEVLAWEPGERLAMTWHPGLSEEKATTVEVVFDEVSPGRTRVTLTHSGWEKRADAADIHTGYQTGWPGVLQRYADVLGASAA
jgi:uncharacterized protein YndB with AHSA1/START domain